jgi:hypothetical protein
MSEELTRMEKRLRFAAALVLIGLIVEALTLEWRHPVAFMIFLAPGALLLLAGIVVFLLSLVSFPSRTHKASEPAESVQSTTQETL